MKRLNIFPFHLNYITLQKSVSSLLKLKWNPVICVRVCACRITWTSVRYGVKRMNRRIWQKRCQPLNSEKLNYRTPLSSCSANSLSLSQRWFFRLNQTVMSLRPVVFCSL